MADEYLCQCESEHPQTKAVCNACLLPLPTARRPLSWLIAAFVLSEDTAARDEIDRRFPVRR